MLSLGNFIQQRMKHLRFLFRSQSWGLARCQSQCSLQFFNLHHCCRDAVVCLGTTVVEFLQHFVEQFLSGFLRPLKRVHSIALNDGNVVLKFLIANETVMFLTGVPVLTPFLTGPTFFALPTELDLFPLDRTRDEWTTHRHAVCAFAATASALALGVVTGTQSARETADTDFRVLDLHGFFCELNDDKLSHYATISLCNFPCPFPVVTFTASNLHSSLHTPHFKHSSL